MLSNHFKIAWRKIVRQKGFTALNLLGLAVVGGTALSISFFRQESFQSLKAALANPVKSLRNE